MFNGLKTFFGVTAAAAATLPTPPPIKVKGKDATSLPSYFTTAAPSTTSALTRSDRGLLNADITAYRTASRNTREATRNFVAASPDLSSAVFHYARLAITNRYVAVAKNLDGTFNVEATALLQQILTRFEVLGDYTQGYVASSSLRSMSESMVKELMLYGSCAAELVLDKSRAPARIQPISVTQIEWFPDGKGVRPQQTVGDAKVNLDVPTFAYVALDQDLLDAYSVSPLEAALQTTLFGHEFLNDVRRVVKRVLHPRLKVTIDEEKFRANIPQEIQFDQEKLSAYMGSFIGDLETKINGLKPEDALIFFDSIGVEYESRGNESLGSEYEILQGLIDAKMSSGSKTMGTILGHGTASSNIASSETMLFVKAVQGSVQEKLNEIYSRLLTVALRVLGVDAYVEFRYNSVELRTETELEAFKQTRQSRILELLSLGVYTDEEAVLEMTGHLPHPGYKPLSGTMFKSKQSTDVTDETSNNGSTLNKSLNPDVPSKARGSNNKANPIKSIVDNVVNIA